MMTGDIKGGSGTIKKQIEWSKKMTKTFKI